MKIISQAPTRISMFGGGTDVSPFCEEHGGLVINMAINLRNRIIINLDAFEEVTVNPLFKGILDNYKKTDSLGFGLEISSREKGAGLGSSGSFAVATIGAIRKYLGMPIERHQIAQEAFELEVKQLGWHGGCQDQFAAAYGGFNLMEINNQVRVRPFSKRLAEDLLPWLVLFDTGIRRKSYLIQNGFRKPTNEQLKALMSLKEIVYQAKDALFKRDFFRLGKLLDRTWEEKKKSNIGVSNPKIDAIFKGAKRLGALSGKICGAGGGGYCWFLCPPKNKEKLIKEMELRNVDFGIDWQGLEVRKE